MCDKNRRLVVWNEHFERVLRFPARFLQIGKPNRDLTVYLTRRRDFGPGDPKEVADRHLGQLWAGEPTSAEIHIGEEKHYEVLSQPTEYGGLVITYTDITDRLAAQEEISRHRDELDELNQQKNKFFSISAHDLKNPFNVMIEYSDMIDGMGNTLPPEKALGISRTMGATSRSLYQLLEDLLA